MIEPWGLIEFALGAAVAVLTLMLLVPATIKALRQPFAKTQLAVEHATVGIAGPPGAPYGLNSLIPSAIAVPPNARAGEQILALDSISDIAYISPKESITDSYGEWVTTGSIDVREHLQFRGQIVGQATKLMSPYGAFHLQLANRSRHNDSCVTVTSARFIVEDIRPIHLSDRIVLVIVNDFTGGRGGGGGFTLETVNASALLTGQGVHKVDPWGPDHGHPNLIKGQGFGLNAGDVRLLDMKLFFAQSGKFKIHLEFEGNDERGRPIVRKTDPVNAAIIVADPGDISRCNPSFVNMCDRRLFLAT